MQHGCDLALGEAKLLGNGLDGVHIPVPAEEHPALRCRQRVQKIVEQLGQLPALDLVLHTAGARNTVLQLVQGKSQLTAAALFSVQLSPTVDGDPARDFPEES